MEKKFLKWEQRKIFTDLRKGHPVGMFPDLSQPETLFHLSVPAGKEQRSLVMPFTGYL